MDTLTMELKVAIRSNLKLDLVDLNPDAGQKPNFLSPNRKNDDEIHFVQFEGRLPAVELSMEAIKQKMAKKMIEIEDWTITDLDNCLDGNPHI